MSDAFMIYLDRLKDETVQKISLELSPEFFDVNEPDLIFQDPTQVNGEAYLAEDDLVLHLTASTTARMPCSICNKMTSIPLAIKGFYHTESISSLKTAIYDLRPPLREALLLELPKSAECPGGCKERGDIAPYLQEEKADNSSETYFPFSDLKYP